MAQRGRKVKPAALKILQGNPGGRRIKNEPKPAKKPPTCPNQLDAQAKKIWKKTAAVLLPLGLISSIDDAILVMYCQTFSIYLDIISDIKRDGAFIDIPVKDKSGEVLRDFNSNIITEPVKNPRLTEFRLLGHQLRIQSAELGMTPTARAHLSVPESDEDEMAGWEKRGESNAS